MKKVSFNNIVTVKYYSVNEKKSFLERYVLIVSILIISLALLYLYL